MAPKSKDGRIRLQEPLATDFAAFRVALGGGATEVGVIRDAVRAYINMRIGREPYLKEAYETERARRHAEKMKPLRLVKPEDG